jgi:branched-subunit amino acid transport protein
VLYGWIFGIERGEEELHRGANIRVPHFVQWILKYVTPVYLLAIFVGICYTQADTYADTLSEGGVASYAVMFILTTLAFLMLLIHIAGRRWDREGRFAAADKIHGS